MYVVPNHMLEQFSREFLQLYPNAKLLVATKDDLTRERRKFLTAKIASGEWDGIIVTHSFFERIGMSREYQEQFLREQIAEYDQLLCDGHAEGAEGHRNIIKTIEKQKAKREERLKDLLPRTRRMMGWCSTNLGLIISLSTRLTTSRTWKLRPRWNGSRASRPAAANGRSTST
jgi:N12 class adenine-specific DNA methylase